MSRLAKGAKVAARRSICSSSAQARCRDASNAVVCSPLTSGKMDWCQRRCAQRGGRLVRKHNQAQSPERTSRSSVRAESLSGTGTMRRTDMNLPASSATFATGLAVRLEARVKVYQGVYQGARQRFDREVVTCRMAGCSQKGTSRRGQAQSQQSTGAVFI